MIDARDEELLNRSLDGDLGPTERRELEERLERHPQLRAYREALERTSGSLSGVGELPPPPGLADGVLEGVRAARGVPDHPRPARIEPPSSRSAVLRYACAFAAGLVIGVTVVAYPALRSASGGRQDGAGLSATMLPTGRLAEAAELDRFDFDSHGTSGSVVTRSVPGFTVAEIELAEAGTAAAFVFSFDPSALAVKGFLQHGAGTPRLEAGEGRLRLEMSGPGVQTLFLGVRDPIEPLRVSIELGPGERAEASLKVVAGTGTH